MQRVLSVFGRSSNNRPAPSREVSQFEQPVPSAPPMEERQFEQLVPPPFPIREVPQLNQANQRRLEETTPVSVERLKCPITLEIMVDPVMSIYGHHFERSAIEAHLRSNPTCPISRQPLNSDQLSPSLFMREVIETFNTSEPEVVDQDESSFEEFFEGPPEAIEMLKQAKLHIYLKPESKDYGMSYQYVYLDMESDIPRLINDLHWDYDGENLMPKMTNFLTRYPNGIDRVQISLSNRAELDSIKDVRLSDKFCSTNFVIGILSAQLHHALPDERIEALFTGPEDSVNELMNSRLFINFKEGCYESEFGHSFLYLDIQNGLIRLINDSHWDFYGRNIINKVGRLLRNNPDFIEQIEFKTKDGVPLNSYRDCECIMPINSRHPVKQVVLDKLHQLFNR